MNENWHWNPAIDAYEHDEDIASISNETYYIVSDEIKQDWCKNGF